MPSAVPGRLSLVPALCLILNACAGAGTPFLTDDAPLAALARAFGFRLESDMRSSRLRLVSAEHELVLALGLPRVLVDGRGEALLEAPRCSGGQILAGPDLADLVRRLAPPEPASASEPSGPDTRRQRPEPGSRPRLSLSPSPGETPSLGAHAIDLRLCAHSGRSGLENRRRPSVSGSSRTSAPVIVLDPGHGGHDEGARGRGGSKEKDIVLDIARRLAAELRDRGARVVLTREDDRFVELRARAAMASREKADSFLSLHANSHPDDRVSGVETWIAEKARCSRPALAAKSLDLARRVQEALVRETRTRDRGVREGTFTVLRESPVPAVLVEIGFLSNPATERMLTDPARCDSLARALANAILPTATK